MCIYVHDHETGFFFFLPRYMGTVVSAGEETKRGQNRGGREEGTVAVSNLYAIPLRRVYTHTCTCACTCASVSMYV